MQKIFFKECIMQPISENINLSLFQVYMYKALFNSQ